MIIHQIATFDPVQDIQKQIAWEESPQFPIN